MLLSYPSDVIAHSRESRSEHHHAVGRFQLRFYRRKHLLPLLLIGSASQNRPALRIKKNPSFSIFAHAKHDAIVGNTSAKPLAIPQVFIDRIVNLLRASTKLLR